MKIGIDTNIFINLFESAEDLAKLRDAEFTIYTHPKCLWEMVKYIKTLELEDKYTEGVVMSFMKRNRILLVKDEAEKQEIHDFEEKCRKLEIYILRINFVNPFFLKSKNYLRIRIMAINF